MKVCCDINLHEDKCIDLKSLALYKGHTVSYTPLLGTICMFVSVEDFYKHERES